MRGIGLAAAAAVLVAGVLGGAGPASAAATPETDHVHAGTETIHDILPCVGPATITITYNAVEHTTTTSTGFHETDTMTGTFTAVLDAGGTSAGKFTIWDGFNTANGVTGETTFTFNGHVSEGIGAGTNWNFVAHLTGPLDPSQLPIVAFERDRCH
jgi:hypothetical protein